MELEKDILRLLIDKYEKSKHYFEGESARSVILNAVDIKRYQSDGYMDKISVHDAVERLCEMGFLDYHWIPHEQGNLLDKLYLKMDRIGETYEFLERIPLIIRVHEAREELESLEASSPWMRSYRTDMIACLTEERRFHRLLPEDADKRGMLLSSLRGLGEITELTERLFSTRYLGNSKDFENHVRSRLITILKTYLGKEMDDDQLLASVGIVRNYDELLLKGDLSIQLDGEWIDLSRFRYGISLNSETIMRIENIKVRGCVILTIENKAVYYERIKSSKNDEIIIYLGGFFGKYTKRFIEQLFGSAEHARYLHWGDIDLGGFMIYDTLKAILDERLTPLHMDIETLTDNLDKAIDFNDSYAERLRKYMERNEGSKFDDVIKFMMKNRVRLEQEVLAI